MFYAIGKVLGAIVGLVLLYSIYLGVILAFLWVALNWIALPALSYIAALFGG